MSLKARIRQEINARQRREHLGVAGGILRWGNFEILYLENAIFIILRGKSKWFNCSKFKSIFSVKKNNYANNVDTGGDPENRSIYCCE